MTVVAERLAGEFQWDGVDPVRHGTWLTWQRSAQDQQVRDHVGASTAMGAGRQPDGSDQVDLFGEPSPPPSRGVSVEREP